MQKNKILKFISVASFLGLFAWSFLGRCYAADDGYIFSSHLDQAEAYSHSLNGGIPIPASFEDQSFKFSELGNSAVISVIPAAVPGIESGRIQLNPQSGRIQKLKFRNVPPAAFLKYTYKFQTEKTDMMMPSFTHFRIWAGKKLLKHERIPGKSEEKSGVVDLGLISFLGISGDFTFEVISSEKVIPGTSFEFSAESTSNR